MGETVNFGVPWENSYEQGNFVGEGDFEKQLRQAYANMRSLLGEFGLGLDSIVSETIYVTDIASQAEILSRIHSEISVIAMK